MAATASGEGLARSAPLAAAAPLAAPAGTPMRAVPSAPFQTALTAGDFGKLVKLRTSTVGYDVDIHVPMSELKMLPDGGATLTLRVGNGISPIVYYSNPADKSKEMLAHGACDFVTAARVKGLKQSSGHKLIATTPVRAMKGEACLQANTVNAQSAPYGLVSAIIDSGECAMLKRDVTKGQAFFIGTYPGQTAANVDAFMYDLKGKPELMCIQAVNPESAALHFYNRLAAVIAAKQYIGANLPANIVAGIPTNEHGIAFGPKALLQQAATQTKAALEASMAYSDVTNPDTMAITIAVRPRDTLRAGKFVSEAIPLARVHETNPSYKSAARQLAAKAGGAAKLDQVDAETILHISGRFEFDYIKAHPNFVLEAAAVEAVSS
jgi:hypothetical protein